jgi:ABC-type Mn2+/Zn2+ transport system permease subunit
VLSYQLDLPTGPVTVLLAGTLYLLSAGVAGLASSRS